MISSAIVDTVIYCGQHDIYIKVEMAGVWTTFTFRKGKLLAQASYTIGDISQMPSGVFMVRIKELLKNF